MYLPTMSPYVEMHVEIQDLILFITWNMDFLRILVN
nr:unnamed protein product [Callosobruchus chinensis]